MSDYVREEELDYDEIVRRGGMDYGDFGLFKCPYCAHIYLCDWEHDWIHLNALDLSKVDVPEIFDFNCASCRRQVSLRKAWVRKELAPDFRVSRELLRRSDWAWTVAALRQAGE